MKKRMFDLLLLAAIVFSFAFAWVRTALADPDNCAESCQEIYVWMDSAGGKTPCTKLKLVDCGPCWCTSWTCRCIYITNEYTKCEPPTMQTDQEWKQNQTCTPVCNLPEKGVWFVEAASPSDNGGWVTFGKQNKCK